MPPRSHGHPFAVSFTSESNPAPAMFTKCRCSTAGDHGPRRSGTIFGFASSRGRGVQSPGADRLGEVVAGAGGQDRERGARAEEAVRAERDRAVTAEHRDDLRAVLGRAAARWPRGRSPTPRPAPRARPAGRAGSRRPCRSTGPPCRVPRSGSRPRRRARRSRRDHGPTTRRPGARGSAPRGCWRPRRRAGPIDTPPIPR